MERFSGKQQRPKEVVARLSEVGQARFERAQITAIESSLGVSEDVSYRWRASLGAVDRDAIRRMSWLTKETPGECAWWRTRN
jgi:hypothetical protein